ncbi:MAG: periplasmic nitrate reductase, NapE protein [Lysobacteraceae bacterium]|mgnify:CR=1 FL=1|jgi:nitrate reductase NapE
MSQDNEVQGDQRRWELGVFMLVVAVVIPLVTVGIVAGYGFLVWMWQIINGPPTV